MLGSNICYTQANIASQLLCNIVTWSALQFYSQASQRFLCSVPVVCTYIRIYVCMFVCMYVCMYNIHVCTFMYNAYTYIPIQLEIPTIIQSDRLSQGWWIEGSLHSFTDQLRQSVGELYHLWQGGCVATPGASLSKCRWSSCALWMGMCSQFINTLGWV